MIITYQPPYLLCSLPDKANARDALHVAVEIVQALQPGKTAPSGWAVYLSRRLL